MLQDERPENNSIMAVIFLIEFDIKISRLDTKLKVINSYFPIK